MANRNRVQKPQGRTLSWEEVQDKLDLRKGSRSGRHGKTRVQKRKAENQKIRAARYDREDSHA